MSQNFLFEFRNNNIPVIQIRNLNLVSCSAGKNHSAAIDHLNNLWVWGNNSNNQLGIPDIEFISQPFMNSEFKVKQVSCGEEITAIIDINDHVHIFGTKEKIGNLKAKRISVGTDFFGLIDLNNNVWIFNFELFGEKSKGIVLHNFKAKEISCGGDHIAFISLDSNLYTLGYNTFGQLGTDDYKIRYAPNLIKNIKPIKICSGRKNIGCIDVWGDVYISGDNTFGQLGVKTIGTLRNKFTKIPNLKALNISVGFDYILIWDNKNRLWGLGNNGNNQLHHFNGSFVYCWPIKCMSLNLNKTLICV